jgi:hypothetical protein
MNLVKASNTQFNNQNFITILHICRQLITKKSYFSKKTFHSSTTSLTFGSWFIPIAFVLIVTATVTISAIAIFITTIATRATTAARTTATVTVFPIAFAF